MANRVRDMLDLDGAWVHVHATTHRGVDGADPLPHPRPPWDRVDELVADDLGPVRRAGQGLLPVGTRSGGEDVMRRAGFTGPARIEVGGGQIVRRTVDEVAAAVFSPVQFGTAPVRRSPAGLRFGPARPADPIVGQ
ncbi:hypothetical protein O7632_12010 [Solwaraspora sp. WMMD406]|uniref:hypothetical protein n=1 Tax=Solwaraspora sp. WMMD406 TaxID=3016095 RepID=UPI002415DB9D|nr:hypothetical protein [Solwaraspora sp. WMMD406]MDG4764818.1 hypothetical protein [Solwaraspora sp. WMMD406]